MKSRSLLSRTFRASTALALVALCAAANADLPAIAGDPHALVAARAPNDIGASATRLTIDEDRLYWDRSPEGVVWVRGNGFKASFGPEGAAITPFLGSDAPRNYPVTFALQSATVGGVEIHVPNGVEALREGAHVRFERGAIVEAYDLDARSIEQSFDLHAPVGVGDLALRIAYASELEARQVADGIEFRNERGGLDYTHAVAMDARGDLIEMPALLVAGAIEIVVPGAFLASATYPVRIDPTVTVSGVDVSTLVHRAPDVAYTFHSSDSMVAFERVFSAADSDVAVAQVSQGGAVVNAVYVDITNDQWTAPSLASVRSHLRYLVAAVRVPAGGVNARVWGRTVSSSAALVSDQFRISGSETGNVSDVEVGGCPIETPNGQFLVTWVRFNDIVRRVVDVTAALASSAIVLDSPTSDSHARVSESDASGAWSIVWHRRQSVGFNSDVMLGRVQSDGSLTVVPIATSTNDEREPNISMLQNGSNRFVVTHMLNTPSTNFLVVAVIMEGTTIVEEFSPSELAGDSDYDCVDPSVETDGSHFLFTYKRLDDARLRIVECYVLDTTPFLERGVVSEGILDTGTSGLPGHSSRFASGSASRRQAIVWMRADDIWLARVDGTAGGPSVPMCFGDGTGTQCPCGNNGAAGRGCANTSSQLGAILTSSGNALVGGDSLLLMGSSMPPNSSCLYFQGTLISPNGTAFGDGIRCASGTIVRLAAKVNGQSGASSYPGPGEQAVSIRGAVPVAGGTRSYQTWYRNAASFCTSSTFNLSNGLRVTFTL